MGPKNITTIFPWRCPRCSQQARSFTTSFRHLQEASSQAGPSPESPRFLPPPESVQANAIPKSRLRGVLPVPRSIFDPKRGGKGRYTDTYFSKVAKPPQKPHQISLSDPQADRNAWKARLASQRRENLRTGISDLSARQARVRLQARLSRAARTVNLESLRQERESRQDTRLTSPTTVANMAPPLRPLRAAKEAEAKALAASWHVARETMPPLKFDALRRTQRAELARKYRSKDVRAAFRTTTSGRIPDPNRETRVAEMKARVAAKEERRVADRQDALHTLYMHARNFITNETQLDAAIEAAFGSATAPKDFGLGGRGVSIWNRQNERSNQSPFEGIADKLDRANKTRGTLQDSEGFAGITNRRLKRIAEELTGGKM